MRRIAENVSIGALIVVTLAVDVFDALQSSSDLLGNLNSVLLVSIVAFLAIDRQRSEERLDLLERGELRKAVARRDYLGITSVRKNFEEDAFIRTIQASKQVRIMQTFIPYFSLIDQALLEAVRRGARVQILLINPRHPAAGLRTAALQGQRAESRWAYDARKTDTRGLDVISQVELNLRSLEAMFVALTERERSYLQVRVYNTLPSVSMYQTDAYLSIGIFYHGRLAIELPQVIFEGRLDLDDDHHYAKPLLDEFDTIWQIGREIDLLHWRDSLDAVEWGGTDLYARPAAPPDGNSPARRPAPTASRGPDG